ncbi:MAG: GNAT family N-acetyltransferase [Chromatiales bacterium]|nr:GNAT family N-acetyltransferase [Chromatiales bacterium]
MDLTILRADYGSPVQAEQIARLLDEYARDPMGGGEPLPAQVRSTIVAALAATPGAFSILAYRGGRAIGLVNALQGLSSFKAMPLINIHDVYVHADHRGLGVARKMLAEVEAVARERGCCKLTLEVLEGNRPAAEAYRAFGFDAYELDPVHGKALFWQKKL